MTTKYRLVKEVFPDRTRYSTERLNSFGSWIYVPGTVTVDAEEEARKLFNDAVDMSGKATKSIIQEADGT